MSKSNMRTLLISPNVGLGSLKLGMNPVQILEAIKNELSDLSEVKNHEIDISKEKEDDGFSLRYMKGSIFFMVRYQNDRAVEISVDRELGKYRTILLNDMDVFNTPAEQIVDCMKAASSCVCDAEDELLGTEYYFTDIGIRFWREEPFHEKLLSDKSYMDTMSVVIEEMYRYLYFDIITVKEIQFDKGV